MNSYHSYNAAYHISSSSLFVYLFIDISIVPQGPDQGLGAIILCTIRTYNEKTIAAQNS